MLHGTGEDDGKAGATQKWVARDVKFERLTKPLIHLPDPGW